MGNLKLHDLLDQKEVLELTDLKRSTLYYYIHSNEFPAPKKLGKRMARWSRQEILIWLKNKGFRIDKLKD